MQPKPLLYDSLLMLSVSTSLLHFLVFIVLKDLLFDEILTGLQFLLFINDWRQM